MADPKLQSAWLRLEYSVLDLVNGGDPVMEAVLFPLARVDIAQQNPSPSHSSEYRIGPESSCRSGYRYTICILAQDFRTSA